MPNQQEIQDAILKVQKLNPSPAVFAKACAKVRDPDTTLSDIAEIIKLDASMTADIIRLSSSAVYGFTEPSANLETAMQRIGLREVYHLLGLSISKSTVASDLQNYGLTSLEYWEKTVSVAILMEELSSALDLPKEESYTIGILHAIGRKVINQTLEQMRVTIFWDGKQSLEEWEVDLIGMNHTEVGSRLMKSWGFPENVAETIKHQLTPELASENVRMLALALNFAIRWTESNGNGFTNPEPQPLEQHPLTLDPHWSGIKLDALLTRCQKRFTDAKQLLAA